MKEGKAAECPHGSNDLLEPTGGCRGQVSSLAGCRVVSLVLSQAGEDLTLSTDTPSMYREPTQHCTGVQGYSSCFILRWGPSSISLDE